MNKTAQYRDGWLAHMNNASTGANPFSDISQAYSHGQWLSGWCDRFNAQKRGEWSEADDDKMQEE